ncbi:MAG TPA: hypothetical protein VIN07_09720 [Flavipsychrobacter sp.]
MIRKSLPFLLLALAFTVTMFSCKKPDDRPAPPQAEQEYYPLEKGKWVLYDVDSTIWDDVFCIERHYAYQVMHRVADTFIDAQERPSYRVETYIRKKVQDAWQSHSVFYVTNTKVTLEMVYDQLRFIKMVFPISEGETWKGNNYILTKDPEYTFYSDWNYQYKKVEESFNTGYKVFDNTVTVEHVDQAVSDPEVFPETYAARTSSREVYASGVGMVYREYIRWTYDPNTTKCRKGNGVVMRAVDHN